MVIGKHIKPGPVPGFHFKEIYRMYVDSLFKRGGASEIIRIVERVDGKRVYKEYAPDYHFFVSDPRGDHLSIYGDPVKKIKPKTFGEKHQLIKSLSSNVRKWESDVDSIFRCLEQNYRGADAPKLNVAFFDIETSFDQAKGGWSAPEDADNYITSISIHLQWRDEMICLAIPPDTMTWDEATEVANQVGNTTLFTKESEMLAAFMDVIEDADIISGWNSESYDIPYVINRIKKVMGKLEARRMCLWDQQPKTREYERGGKKSVTYDTIGRVHIDYLQLYKKYNYEERHSYKLDSIAEIELGDNKVEYDGTLDDLYNDDFKKFLEYNIQDTRLLDRLDKKLQFIDLANSIAHDTCVLIQTTTGTVAVTDQAILMEAHARGCVCMDKVRRDDTDEVRAAGGWVATPKKGLHKWLASTDMKSLYPSIIRALNMSPETIVGQIRLDRTNQAIADWESRGPKWTFAGWWNDRFNVLEMDDFYNQDISNRLTLDMENGDSFEVTGKELHDLIFKGGAPWCISANGTIYKTDVDGIVPALLARWYSERKILQARKTVFEGMLSGVDIDEVMGLGDVSVVDAQVTVGKVRSYTSESMDSVLETGDVHQIRAFLDDYGLQVNDNRVSPKESARPIWREVHGYYDKLQTVKKLGLNGTYGALLNAGSRFFDQRIGQSTTLSGRTVTKHMAAKTNEMIAGDYDHYGDAIIYGDTDSAYFSAYPTLRNEIESGDVMWDKDSIIEMYNGIAKAVSATFPHFLADKLNVPLGRSTGVIASSREIVAESGIWMVKKRYACLMIDKDRFRLDVEGKPGKVKAMGLDLKRADTPKFIQTFLSDILMDTLTGKGESAVIDKIRIFKESFEDMKPWQQGTPKSVNKLSHYRDKLEDAMLKKMKGLDLGNLHVPGHVTASLAWNRLKEINRDQHTMKITDGQKVIVCKLKESSENTLTSIAYPVDETRLPDWFMCLPFDSDMMMAGVVDKKITNLLGVLKWDLKRADKQHGHMATLFDFGAL